MKPITKLLISLFLLNFLDFLTTIIGLQIGLKESNPIIQSLNPLDIILKLFVIPISYSACIYGLNLYAKPLSYSEKLVKFSILLTLALNIFYALIIINNIALILNVLLP